MPSFRFNKKYAILATVLLFAGFFSLGWLLVNSVLGSPSQANFAEKPTAVIIEKGQNVKGVSRQLKESGVVKSASVVQSLILFLGGENKVKAGYYEFAEPQPAFAVAKRIVAGDFGYTPVRFTVAEGADSKRIASAAEQRFPHVSTSTLLQLAREKEGYLFPETYFFSPIVTAEEIVRAMSLQFDNQMRPHLEAVERSGRTLDEIIILASILEREVQTSEDMSMVADLLLRRMRMGMPLQVDATLMYVTGRGSAELTLTDLRTDHLYNTYTRKGLPPTAIGNPGIRSILAALNPTPNPYVFYLSDKDGITHFSRTYAEHLKLRDKYLR